MFKKFINKKIITTIIIVITVILSLIFGYYSFKSYQIKKLKSSTKQVIENKWPSIYNLHGDSQYKQSYILNVIDIQNPKLFYIYTIGFNEDNGNDNNRFLKFDLEYNNLNLELKDTPTQNFAFGSKKSFNEVKRMLEYNNFEDLKNRDNGNYLGNSSYEKTQEEVEEQRERERFNKEFSDNQERLENRTPQEFIEEELKNIELFRSVRDRCLVGEKDFIVYIESQIVDMLYTEELCGQMIDQFPEYESDLLKQIEEKRKDI